ncbi:IclR family transcriptional regulator [Enterococcus sp. LJL128]|uniref:IclR family transcriptional regulator n=1 Tax=Enterococcus sp. LJL51 TaxID=3416656 RepID=UPI003CF15D77
MSSELQSVKNALLILKCFSADQPKLRVTELSERTGLAKSTVSRSLTTLASEGFIKKASDNQSYMLGLSIINLAGVALSAMRIQQEVSPALSQLVVRTGESSHIAILDGLDTVYIQKEESITHTKIQTHLGKRNPSHATSSGKILLAFQEQSFQEKYFDMPLNAFTPQTITNPFQLREELKKVKKAGFAYSKDELTEGVSSLAAPVWDYSGSVVASLGIVGATTRFSTKKIREFVPLIIDASKAASENLGFRR